MPVDSHQVITAYKSTMRNLKTDIAKFRGLQVRHFGIGLAFVAAGIVVLLAAFKVSSGLFPIPPILLLGASWKFRQGLKCRARILDLSLRSIF